MSEELDFSDIDEMDEKEAKRELKMERFDELTRPELLEKIADYFDLEEEQDYAGSFHMSGLKKIYLKSIGEFESL